MRRNKSRKVFAVMRKISCLVLLTVLCVGVTFGMSVNEVKAASWPSGTEVGAASAIVIEANTGTILYQKDAHTQRYPASITKIMTTLLALENCELDEIVTYSEDAVYKTEGSGIFRNVGEQMTLEQTLYAVMLESANECAYATAEHVAGGDYQAFVDLMNQRAKEIGCLNTHFNNPHGLPDEQHLTTAYDMGMIATEAIKNDMFRTLCSTVRYELPATNKSLPLTMLNHHKMISNHITAEFLYDGCIGGKTGYTQVARNTLVTYAERDGMLLVCVVMRCEGTTYQDTIKLLDYCFDNFKVMNVAANETRYSSDVSNSSTMMTQNDAFAQLDENAVIVLPKDADFMETETEVSYEGTGAGAMGSLVYRYGDRVVGQADVVKTGAQVDGYDFSEGNADVEPSDITVLQGEVEKEKHPVATIIIILVIIALAVFLVFVIRVKLTNRRWRNMRHPDRQYIRIRNRKRRRRRRGRW